MTVKPGVEGYNAFAYEGRTIRAHRYSYELFVGPIPDGLVIDHMCRNRACVNPDHLRVVDRRTNTIENSTSRPALNAMKTHCANGHPYDDTNTVLIAGKRRCRQCTSSKNHQQYLKRKARKPVRPRRPSPWDDNPDHVSGHCTKGHAIDIDNHAYTTDGTGKGFWRCLICLREYKAAHHLRRKAARS